MSSFVPTQSVYPQEHFVRGGDVVKSLTMQDCAKSLLWSIGRGGQLVPGYTPNNYELAASTTARLKFYVQPRYQAFSRIWTVGAIANPSSDTTQNYTVAIPAGGTAQNASASTSTVANVPSIYYHHLSAQSSTTGELSIDIANGSGKSIRLQSISCFEAPRLEMALDASDYGVDMETLAHRQPIYDTTAKSIGGLGDLAVNAFTVAQRNGLFMHAWPIVVGSGTTATRNITFADGYDDLFETSAGGQRNIPILARKQYRDGVSGYDLKSVNVAALAAVTGGTGEVIFTMTNGSTTTLTISATDATFGGTSAGAWVTGTINVDTEDANSSDGRRDTTWDLCRVEGRKLTSGTMYVAAVSIWGG